MIYLIQIRHILTRFTNGYRRMSMLIYLCEDSESDALRLRHHLNTYADKNHCDMEIMLFSSGEKMIQFYKEQKRYPALLFLDIYMNDQDGMETARILRSLGYTGGIIFTTSSTEHAMASYEVNALYYLQKPYSHNDFMNAMNRCNDILEDSMEVFSFSLRRKEYSLPYSDILFFETGQHNVLLHTVTETFTIPGNLTQLTQDFDSVSSFIPVGRSYLVNLNHVTGILQHDLIMEDNSIVQIPFRKREEVNKAVHAWLSQHGKANAPLTL